MSIFPYVFQHLFDLQNRFIIRLYLPSTNTNRGRVLLLLQIHDVRFGHPGQKSDLLRRKCKQRVYFNQLVPCPHQQWTNTQNYLVVTKIWSNIHTLKCLHPSVCIAAFYTETGLERISCSYANMIKYSHMEMLASTCMYSCILYRNRAWKNYIYKRKLKKKNPKKQQQQKNN